MDDGSTEICFEPRSPTGHPSLDNSDEGIRVNDQTDTSDGITADVVILYTTFRTSFKYEDKTYYFRGTFMKDLGMSQIEAQLLPSYFTSVDQFEGNHVFSADVGPGNFIQFKLNNGVILTGHLLKGLTFTGTRKVNGKGKFTVV
ncbi:hypothetical protein CVT24_012906 [Panaeolus cyanescens]|uniref:Uncharacterized protein n=1 Tax=Panaeolus cyanescens TaxID=181874 RepID=A0A409W2W1_9AGAR|nr:hypothetical protein CVT24_012906 [Panaeolus cyanescens]